MVKVFRGFRFDVEVYEAFCRLAEAEGLTATAALQRYMQGCVEADQVASGEAKAIDYQAEVQVLIDWLGKGKYFYRNPDGAEISIQGRLLTLLPKIKDAALKREAQCALKDSVKKQA